MKLDIAKLEDERCLVDFGCGKRGLGHIIVEAIVEKAQNQDLAGCQFLTVEALHTKDYSAVGFYERCGFSPCDYPNPNKDPCVCSGHCIPNRLYYNFI